MCCWGRAHVGRDCPRLAGCRRPALGEPFAHRRLAPDDLLLYIHWQVMAPEQKSEAFFVRMGVTETRMLLELSDKTGLSRSDVVRQLIRREHAQVFGEEPRPKPKPKRR